MPARSDSRSVVVLAIVFVVFALVFFGRLVPGTFRFAFTFRSFVHGVLFCGPHFGAPRHGHEGMHIDGAVGPRPPPRGVVDDQRVLTPGKSCRSPAPRRECRTNSDAKSKTDGADDRHAGTRRREDDGWIVVRHDA